MATRKEIINQLKDDFRKISVANGYDTEIQDVRVGILDESRFSSKPAIGLLAYEDEVVSQSLGTAPVRNLKFMCYGCIDVTENYDEYYEELYDFVKDTEKFLYSTDNENKEETLITLTKVNYGGVVKHIGYFIIYFDINYNQTDI